MSNPFSIKIIGIENSDKPGFKDIYTSQGKVSQVNIHEYMHIMKGRDAITHAEYLQLMSKNQKNYKRKDNQ